MGSIQDPHRWCYPGSTGDGLVYPSRSWGNHGKWGPHRSSVRCSPRPANECMGRFWSEHRDTEAQASRGGYWVDGNRGDGVSCLPKRPGDVCDGCVRSDADSLVPYGDRAISEREGWRRASRKSVSLRRAPCRDFSSFRPSSRGRGWIGGKSAGELVRQREGLGVGEGSPGGGEEVQLPSQAASLHISSSRQIASKRLDLSVFNSVSRAPGTLIREPAGSS